MVRIATSVLAASLLAIPALAAFSEQYERSVAESDLYGRDFIDVEDTVIAREQLDEIFGREFVNDIEERSPFGLGFLVKGIKAAVKIGKKAHSAHSHVSGNNNQNNHRREFDDEEFDLREFDEDLEAREPGKFGTALRVGKSLARKGAKFHNRVGGFSQFIPQNNDQYRRELDDEFDLREFDEDMEAREPGFGGLFKIGKTLASKGAKLAHKGGKHHPHGHGLQRAKSLSEYVPQQNSDPSQNQRREFDEEFDLREFDEDMEAREPGFGGLFKIGKTLASKGAKLARKGGKHHKHHHHHKSQALSESMPQQNNDPSQNQQRDFDEEMYERDFDLEDILERDYFDELD